MKSNSIAGLAYALFPADTYDQSTQVTVDTAVSNGSTDNEIIISDNNFYLFAGEMPAAADLQVYSDPAAFKAAYASSQILAIESFDIRWTYDKTLRRRKLEKWPVDAETFSSAVDGTAGWAMIEIIPQSLSTSEKLMIFTDAVGGWDDADQSILLSDTVVVAGESITVKSLNITVQDALVVELV